MNTNNQGMTSSKRPQPTLQGESSKTDGQDKHTRPPRVSFGVELEFLVFNRTTGVDDESVAGLPSIEVGYIPVEDRIAQTLRAHGLDAYTRDERENDRSRRTFGWFVDYDGSVTEHSAPLGAAWETIELNSPPMYSCDEAFRLLEVVVRILTTNFRLRVNQTCGVHVHVGNGPHHLDMRAARNYAALLWASDSVLSTLHCPGRSVCKYSNSNRRIAYTDLSRGMNAKQAHDRAAKASTWIPRYLGRARKLGESPIVSRQKLRQHLLEQEHNADGEMKALDPECSSDDSNWEKADSKPFFRPKKQPHSQAHRQRRMVIDHQQLDIKEEEEARIENESIKRELPPQVNFDLVDLDPPPPPEPGSTLKPFLEEERPRKKQVDVEEILKDKKIMDRYDQPTHYPAAESWKPTWPGVKELLSCDAGVHQVALLMSRNEPGDWYARYTSSNWAVNTPGAMLPGDPRSRDGRRTVESRLASGSLDAKWIVTWAKIQCRMLEWARDAEPSAFMEVLCKLARDDRSDECTYDVLDLLRDLGLYTEIKICQERLERAEEACGNDASSRAGDQGDTSLNNTDDKTSSDVVGWDDPEDIYDAN
ncbi:hypothetical protein BHE90_006757 [Fusarium euwallaceae]|uniref:Amidoligase enzyme n=1 Tax=Fusarium euwallaceae TaxID=1147111 RepID=A0A430LSS8_9HYPO|nr:hypothetical protein BHE90_006757 [Fusarium euwallaceae]